MAGKPITYPPLSLEIQETFLRAFLNGDASVRAMLTNIGQPNYKVSQIKKLAYLTGRGEDWERAVRIGCINAGRARAAKLNRHKTRKPRPVKPDETILNNQVQRHCLYCKQRKLMPILHLTTIRHPSGVPRQVRVAQCSECKHHNYRMVHNGTV